MKSLFLTLSLLFMVGCGSGGESTPQANNEELSSSTNGYGHIGEDVVFGTLKVSRIWTLCADAGCINASFSRTGSFSLSANGETESGTYGVSKDGKEITMSGSGFNGNMTITLKSTLSNAHTLVYNGVEEIRDCYNVHFNDSLNTYALVFCPWS